METIVQFKIQYNQIMNDKGELNAPLPTFAEDVQQLIYLYKQMNLARLFDKKAIALQRTGQLGTYPSILGHEAVGIGIGYAMDKDDVFVPYYRDHATLMQRGITMTEIYNYWGGDERGNDYQIGNQDFPPCIPIATQSLHATGIASAFKFRNQPRVAVTTCGDGATSKGDFYEAINVAGAWKLPVIFVVSNNQWAISVPLSKQTATETLAQKAIAANIHGEQIDGNDIIGVVDSMNKALTRARNGEGATLIEMMTYRLTDHTTADDASRYREQAEVDEAWQREPLARLRLYLNQLGAWDGAKEQAMLAECSAQVEQSVKDYLAITPEPLTAIFDYMYADIPEELLIQRESVTG